MECVTEVSPTASVSPPISPVKFVHHKSSLPPAKNLPTWSRTSLGRSKHHRSLSRDVTAVHHGVIMEENTCRSTQTSPSVAATRAPQTIFVANIGKNEQQNIVKTLEKKLQFVQNQYEDVLSRLREEVGALKRENMELTFKVVMHNGDVSFHPELADAATSPIPILEPPKETNSVAVETLPDYNREKEDLKQEKKIHEMKLLTMDKELRSLRHGLKDAKDQNTYLLDLVEKQKQSQRMGTKSAKGTLDAKKVHSHSAVKQQASERLLPLRNPPLLPPVDVNGSLVPHRPEDFATYDHFPPPLQHRQSDSFSSSKEDIEKTQSLNDLYAGNEYGLQRYHYSLYEAGEIRHKTNKHPMILPFKHDAPIKKPLEPLPRLTMGLTGRPTKFREGHRTEVAPLPSLRVPQGSLLERQRRAHALHVQRQKSNREFTVFKLM